MNVAHEHPELEGRPDPSLIAQLAKDCLITLDTEQGVLIVCLNDAELFAIQSCFSEEELLRVRFHNLAQGSA